MQGEYDTQNYPEIQGDNMASIETPTFLATGGNEGGFGGGVGLLLAAALLGGNGFNNRNHGGDCVDNATLSAALAGSDEVCPLCSVRGRQSEGVTATGSLSRCPLAHLGRRPTRYIKPPPTGGRAATQSSRHRFYCRGKDRVLCLRLSTRRHSKPPSGCADSCGSCRREGHPRKSRCNSYNPQFAE